MLFTLSIPLVDYRPLLNYDTHRLDVAQFPRNWNDNSFLRNFGRFGVRINPGCGIPYSEKKYAHANNGIRIANQDRITRGSANVVPSCVFRRVFFDAYSARFDIGIKNVSSDYRVRYGWLNIDDINNAVKALIGARVYSTRFTKKEPVELRKLGNDLVFEYIYATTKNPRENVSDNSKRLMSVGIPTVVVEVREEEVRHISTIETKGFKRFRHIPEEWGIALGYRTITRDNIPVFVLVRKKNASKEKLRALRINLLKHHQERITLEAVMRLIARESQEELRQINTSALSKYLDNVTSVYSRKSREGINQYTIFDVMRNVEREINNDECISILRILQTDDRLSFLSNRFKKTMEKLYSIGFESDECVMMLEPAKTVFLSYKSEDAPIASLIRLKLEEKLGSRIRVSQYTDLDYKSSFREFMNGIEDHDFVICIVSDKYLKSSACMYEVGEVVKSHHYVERLLHIILRKEDAEYYNDQNDFAVANVFEPESRLAYIQYWKSAYERLKDSIVAIDDNEATIAEVKTLREYHCIYKEIGEFLEYLSKNNAKTLKEHVDSGFEEVVKFMGL